MGTGMIEDNGLPPLPVYLRLNAITDAQGARGNTANMCNRITALLLRITHLKNAIGRLQLPVITHLATGLRIKRCLVEHYDAGFAWLQCINGLTLAEQCHDTGLVLKVFIAGKHGAAIKLQII